MVKLFKQGDLVRILRSYLWDSFNSYQFDKSNPYKNKIGEVLSVSDSPKYGRRYKVKISDPDSFITVFESDLVKVYEF